MQRFTSKKIDVSYRSEPSVAVDVHFFNVSAGLLSRFLELGYGPVVECAA